MRFTPPAVEFKKPKAETVLAFMQSKGWALEKKDERFYIFRPPDELKSEAEGGFRYYYPVAEESVSYDELAFQFVETFSQLYEIPIQELFDLLSKSLSEIRQEVRLYPKRLQMRKAVLANAQ